MERVRSGMIAVLIGLRRDAPDSDVGVKPPRTKLDECLIAAALRRGRESFGWQRGVRARCGATIAMPAS
jgi:hypothetical protein